MRLSLWPNETALAVIRPDRQVYWYIQGLVLCAAYGAVNLLALLWQSSESSSGGFFQLLIGTATIVGPILLNAWRELQLVWVLTDRRVILGRDDYVMLDDLADIHKGWASLTLTSAGKSGRSARLTALNHPESAAARIQYARDTGR